MAFAVRAVQNYKPLIKDFPINELLTASDITKLADAIVKLFQHLKKAKNAHYPIPRYLRLVEVSHLLWHSAKNRNHDKYC